MNWHEENCLEKEGVSVESWACLLQRVGQAVLGCCCSTHFKRKQRVVDRIGFVGMYGKHACVCGRVLHQGYPYVFFMDVLKLFDNV